MLQHQIIYKQLQELQRRQQLQELDDVKNQVYLNQLPSLKLAPGVQFLTTFDCAPVHDRQSFMVGNMQMMQHGGSNYFPGLPNEIGFLQGTNHGFGPMNFSEPELGVSSYETNLMNADMTLNQYLNIQVPPNYSGNYLTKTQNSGLFYQQGSVIRGKASVMESELKHEDTVSLDPLEQKILYNTHENTWETSFSRSDKIDAGGVENNVDSPMDGLSSLQSGSWSALMQSAVAEMSSGDNGKQDKWSGLSFQNPEASKNNQSSNFMDSDSQQNNWIDRNLQDISSLNSKEEHMLLESNTNSSFPGFQLPDNQYLQHKEKFNSETFNFFDQHPFRSRSELADYKSHQRHPTGGNETIQVTLPSPNTRHDQYKENRKDDQHEPSVFSSTNQIQSGTSFGGNDGGTFYFCGNALNHMSDAPFDQTNQIKILGYSEQSHKTGPSNNVETMSAFLGSSSNLPFQEMTQSGSDGDALNKDDISGDHTQETRLTSFSKPWYDHPLTQDFGFRYAPADSGNPQSYSSSPSFSTRNSSPATVSNHNVKEHIKNQHPVPPVFPFVRNVADTQQTETSVALQYTGFASALPQQQLSSQKTGDFSPNLSGFPGSSSTDLKTFEHGQSSQYPGTSEDREGLEGESSLHEGSVAVHYSSPLSTNSSKHESSGQHASDVAFGSLTTRTQVHNQVERNDIISDDARDFSKKLPFKYDLTNYHQAIANAKELLLKGKMNPSLFRNYARLKNGQTLLANDRKALTGISQSVSAISTVNFPENSLIRVNATNADRGSVVSPSVSSTLTTSKRFSPILSSGVTHQDLPVLLPKKRKIVEIDMVPWHKEVDHELMKPQTISMANFVWAVASNRKQELTKNEAEAGEDDVLPVVRAKRRLIMTTHVMQQVFRPTPTVILSADACLNYDSMTYFSARSTLGDSCNIANKLPAGIDKGMYRSPDNFKTPDKSTKCDFLKIAEGLVSRLKKLEGDLSRVSKSLSILDIKIESQELEKFSLINRFAKCHVKANPTANIPANSSGSSLHKLNLQRYVIGHQMPSTIPKGLNCFSL